MRRFGMLFQNSALFDSMTVFDNVAFPLRESERRLSRKELRTTVLEKLELVGFGSTRFAVPLPEVPQLAVEPRCEPYTAL